jgi:RNA-directed DNA polymerase
MCMHMYDDIITLSNIYKAWNQFKIGKQYKPDVALFSKRLDVELYNIYRDLQNLSYSHSPYTHFTITDPKSRDIHKALVRDRIVHHLLYNALYSYFDKKFIYDSYSCRLGKGTHKARLRFEYFYNKCSLNKTKQVWVLKCDIRKFFASIDHDILKTILQRHIQDEKLLFVLFHIIDSFHTQDTLRKGLPLGNLTSQLFVNIYMNEFDQYIKHILKVKYYIRYADDFVILSQDKNYVHKILEEIQTSLKEKLKLDLHPNKVSISTYSSGVDFLGFVHFPYHKVLRTTTKKRMVRRLADAPTKETIYSYKGLLKWGNT